MFFALKAQTNVVGELTDATYARSVVDEVLLI